MDTSIPTRFAMSLTLLDHENGTVWAFLGAYAAPLAVVVVHRVVAPLVNIDGGVRTVHPAFAALYALLFGTLRAHAAPVARQVLDRAAGLKHQAGVVYAF